MIPNISDPKIFIKFFCKEAGVKVFDPTDRACVITRSPAVYGRSGSVIVEWEGSPPRFSIYRSGDGALVIDGKLYRWQINKCPRSMLDAFVDANPPNEYGSPIWIGPRLEERRMESRSLIYEDSRINNNSRGI